MTYSEGFKPKLGALPRPEGQPVMSLAPLAPAALPAPPPEVHNIERDTDTSMLGNDVWGNCVFAGIENDRRISALALGKSITWLTAQQVINKYTAFTGATSPPGPGAVVVDALNWVRKDPAGWGGNHILFYGDLAHTELAIRQGVSEFQSVITAQLIRAAQEWPSKDWAHTLTAVLGGHATAGGTYTTLADFLKTWGYMVKVEPSFFAYDIDEIVVVVWDFQWDSLTYDRQVSLIADLQALTGKTWTGPAPVAPPEANMIPHRPTPHVVAVLRQSATGPAATSLASIDPAIRVIDEETGAFIVPTQFAYEIAGQSMIGPGACGAYATNTTEGIWLSTDAGKPVAVLARNTITVPTA